MLLVQNAPPFDILHWLYTNAPAAWLSFLVALCAFLVTLRFRKKPRRIVFRETENTSLVTIWPSVRNMVDMTFAGRRIVNLNQVTGQLFNEGSEEIKNPSITVKLPDGAQILGYVLKPEQPGARPTVDGTKITITLPFLNPMKEHGHIVEISVLSDGEIETLQVSGSGEGWSVRHSPLPTRKQYERKNRMIMTVGAIIAAVAFFYSHFVDKKLGIPSEFTSNSLLWHSPMYVITILWGFWFYKHSEEGSRLK